MPHTQIASSQFSLYPRLCRLPADLERSIFLLAASEWTPRDAVELLLVAKRVYEWIRPILFQVFIQVDAHPPKFPDFVKYPSIKLGDVGRFAKHLLIGIGNYDEPDKEVRRLLSSCPNVCDLTLWLSAESFKILLPLIQNLPLTRLSTAFGCLVSDDILVPAFSNLTHLDLLDINDARWNIDKWTMLTRLPALSHLSIGFTPKISAIRQLLAHCKQLRILILAMAFDHSWVVGKPRSLFGIEDDRLVLMICIETFGAICDWENGANGRVDSWTIAESFSVARQRKFLNDCSQKWISTSFDLERELNAEGKEWYSTSGINGTWEEDPWEDEEP